MVRISNHAQQDRFPTVQAHKEENFPACNRKFERRQANIRLI